ncbi:MAG: hypothetical protein RIQ81_2678 [Pseudomonadota bacterium]|jgi:hypothetical protein
MIIHCPTPHAVVLVPLDSGSGLWLFPSDPGPWAGLRLEVTPLQPVIPQIMESIAGRLGVSLVKAGYDVSQSFQEVVQLPEGPATLYVVQPPRAPYRLIPASALQAATPSAGNAIRFATLPEWLGRMPVERQRLAWLKAWQVYQGVAALEVKAVELDEVIRATTPREPQP